MNSKYIAMVGAVMLVLATSACTNNQGVNAATGAVIGGVIGNQLGNGSGKKVATILGVGAGAAIGANAEK